MPIARILAFISSLAITRADLPYSVAANSKMLISSPPSLEATHSGDNRNFLDSEKRWILYAQIFVTAVV